MLDGSQPRWSLVPLKIEENLTLMVFPGFASH